MKLLLLLLITLILLFLVPFAGAQQCATQNLGMIHDGNDACISSWEHEAVAILHLHPVLAHPPGTESKNTRSRELTERSN